MPAPRIEHAALPRIVTRQRALAAGMTDDAIRHRLALQEWRRVGWGAYVRDTDGDLDDGHGRIAHVDRAIAAGLRRPGAVLAGSTAAIIHGLPVISPLPDAVQMIRPLGGTSHAGLRSGVNMRRLALRDVEVLSIGAVQVTSIPRTIIDLACDRREDGLAAADAALACARTDGAELRQALGSRRSGDRGVRGARWVVAQASGARESPLESWSWSRFAGWGLPLPEMQQTIVDDDGRFLARVDFLWRAQLVIGEADGRGKYATADDLYREKRREDALRARGWTVVRWAWTDLAAGTALRRRLATLLCTP